MIQRYRDLYMYTPLPAGVVGLWIGSWFHSAAVLYRDETSGVPAEQASTWHAE